MIYTIKYTKCSSIFDEQINSLIFEDKEKRDLFFYKIIEKYKVTDHIEDRIYIEEHKYSQTFEKEDLEYTSIDDFNDIIR